MDIMKSGKELLYSGHSACPGCGAMILARYVLNALGEKTIMIIPASCWTLLAGSYPYTALKIPVLHCPFETAAATAAGVSAGVKIRGIKATVLVWAGDGGTFDIGLQALSSAAEKNTDFIYVCYDNEAYMNTGIQRSSATPLCAWTTTTPKGMLKTEPKKNIMEIVAAHGIPYAATATIAFPEDLIMKVKKAKEIKGTKFLHLLSPCVIGWKIESGHTVKVSRLAVETNIFPLYEIFDGEKWVISRKPEQPKPTEEYLKIQGRFSHLAKEDIGIIQKNTDKNWQKLLKKEFVES